MTLQIGNDDKLYYNSGTDAAPTWVLIDIVGDVTLEQGINEAEVDLRLLDTIVNLPAKKTAGLSAAIATHFGNAIYDALHDLWQAKTLTQYASSNIPIATNGAEYYKMFAFPSSWPWSQATQEMDSHDTTLSPAYAEEPAGTVILPGWVVTP